MKDRMSISRCWCIDACKIASDDFNDGTVDSNWLVSTPPPTESGGKFHFTNGARAFWDYALMEGTETGGRVSIDITGIDAVGESHQLTIGFGHPVGAGRFFDAYCIIKYDHITGCGTISLSNRTDVGLATFRPNQDNETAFTLNLCITRSSQEYGYGYGYGDTQGKIIAWISDSSGRVWLELPYEFGPERPTKFGMWSNGGDWDFDNFSLHKIELPDCPPCERSFGENCLIWNEDFLDPEGGVNCRWSTATDSPEVGDTTKTFKDPMLLDQDVLKVIAIFRANPAGVIGLKGAVTVGGNSFTVWFDEAASKWKMTDGTDTNYDPNTEQFPDDKFAIEVCVEDGIVYATGVKVTADDPPHEEGGGGPFAFFNPAVVGMTKPGNKGQVSVTTEGGLELCSVTMSIVGGNCGHCRQWSPPCELCEDTASAPNLLVSLVSHGGLAVANCVFGNPVEGVPNCDAVLRSYLLERNPFPDGDGYCYWSPPGSIHPPRSTPPFACGPGGSLLDSRTEGLDFLSIYDFKEVYQWCQDMRGGLGAPSYFLTNHTLPISPFEAVVCEHYFPIALGTEIFWERLSFTIKHAYITRETGPDGLRVHISGIYYLWFVNFFAGSGNYQLQLGDQSPVSWEDFIPGYRCPDLDGIAQGTPIGGTCRLPMSVPFHAT